MKFILNRPFSWSEFTGLRVPHGPNIGMAKKPLQPLAHSAGGYGLLLPPRSNGNQKFHLCIAMQHQQLWNGIAD